MHGSQDEVPGTTLVLSLFLMAASRLLEHGSGTNFRAGNCPFVALLHNLCLKVL